MLIDSFLLHRKLRRNWSKLQNQYRKALPELVSDESWQRTFEEQA
jgi:galactofuranosylgalactofuranosylrhamnosyl-N-acetylglucosaminyl-diphospho-decaprenol beta-1,5/1,6-galactofuranosyltransferase